LDRRHRCSKDADTPEAFDVLVLPNLYGDVLSDVARNSRFGRLAGSQTLHICDVEAIQWSAPRRPANLANPSGLSGRSDELVHVFN